VACGYSQVPGIDFSESFAPVLNDVSFIIAKLVWNMTCSVVERLLDFMEANLKRDCGQCVMKK
jgi:hypothetical protein